MKVKATKIGFHNKLMHIGEEFDYPVNKDKSNLGSWIEIVKQTRKQKTPVEKSDGE